MLSKDNESPMSESSYPETEYTIHDNDRRLADGSSTWKHHKGLIINRRSRRHLKEIYSGGTFVEHAGAKFVIYGPDGQQTPIVSSTDWKLVEDAIKKLNAAMDEVFENTPTLQAAEAWLEDALRSAENSAQETIRQDYLGALSNLADIRESRLTLLNRTAKLRDELAETCDLVDYHDFAKLASGQIDPNASNLSRAFGRLRERKAALCVERHGKNYYPAIQIDRKSLTIYPEIPALLQDAHKQDYTDWDILEWLASDQVLQDISEFPGKPIEYASPDDLLESLSGLEAPSVNDTSYIPIELLHTGQSELFRTLRQQWLGNP